MACSFTQGTLLKVNYWDERQEDDESLPEKVDERSYVLESSSIKLKSPSTVGGELIKRCIQPSRGGVMN